VPFASLALRARARVKIWVRVSPDTLIISKDYNIEYRLDYR
jgi:hypothetical protein